MVVDKLNPENHQIMVVDDDRGIRIMLRYFLEQEGYSVIEASDGSQALNYYLEYKPDVVLMDTLMPKMDGFTACAQIQQLSGGNGTSVLMVTVLDDPESVGMAFNAGAADYITKPINWAVLRHRLKRLLHTRVTEAALHKAHRELEQRVEERTAELVRINRALQAEIAERKQIEDKLRYLSLHDGLTGLYNRVYFEEEMHRLEGMRYSAVGIIVVDVDGLKFINDTLGHKMGDSLLVRVAQVLKACFREGDMVARIGGDEFTVLLPNHTKAMVERAYRRIQEAVTQHNETHKELPLCLSLGFAVNHKPNMPLSDVLREADNNMYREKLNRRGNIRSVMMQTLFKVLQKRNLSSVDQMDYLQGLALKLATAIKLPEHRLTDLLLLVQFYDIGKVGIPEGIYFKAGPLTAEEYDEMQGHCEIGYRIAQSAPELIPIADWILKHHEWWNGKGYPLGLKGEEIPLECRILAVIDAYTAMTSDRPYRKALLSSEALLELKKGAGTQFDPNLVEKFTEAIGCEN